MEASRLELLANAAILTAVGAGVLALCWAIDAGVSALVRRWRR